MYGKSENAIDYNIFSENSEKKSNDFGVSSSIAFTHFHVKGIVLSSLLNRQMRYEYTSH